MTQHGGVGCGKIMWEIEIREKMWRMIKNTTECARSAVILDGEISNHVDILPGVAQGCTQTPNLFKVYINDMIQAPKAAKQGVTMGGRYSIGVDVCGWFHRVM